MSFDSNSSSHSGNAASLYHYSPVIQAYHFTKEPSPSIDKTRHVLRLLGRVWASPTLAGLHCGSVFMCLWPYTVILKLAYSNISWRSISCTKACYEGYWAELPECSVADPEWRQLKLTTFDLCVYRPSMAGHSQAVQICTVVAVASGRASHAWHA